MAYNRFHTEGASAFIFPIISLKTRPISVSSLISSLTGDKRDDATVSSSWSRTSCMHSAANACITGAAPFGRLFFDPSGLGGLHQRLKIPGNSSLFNSVDLAYHILASIVQSALPQLRPSRNMGTLIPNASMLRVL